ncbi:hypothetical protein MNBD_CHLOROFLEXI01-2377, partial [hydrothermal vent metagenome]
MSLLRRVSGIVRTLGHSLIYAHPAETLSIVCVQMHKTAAFR